MPVLNLTAITLLMVFVFLLAWVVCNSQDIYGDDRICLLLGVTDKTETIKLLGLAIAGVVAFFWGGGWLAEELMP